MMPAQWVFFGSAQMPPGCREEAARQPDSTGLFVSYYADGQLRKLTFVKEGQDFEWLTLKAGKPAGRRENTAEVQEFLPNGTVEEYAGRFEHGPYRPGVTFEAWVQGHLRDLMEVARTGQNVEFIRGHLL